MIMGRLADLFLCSVLPLRAFQPKNRAPQPHDDGFVRLLNRLDIGELLKRLEKYPPIPLLRQKICFSQAYLPISFFEHQEALVRHGLNDQIITRMYRHIILAISEGNSQAVRINTDGSLDTSPVYFPQLTATMGEELLAVFLNWLGQQIPVEEIQAAQKLSGQAAGVPAFFRPDGA